MRRVYRLAKICSFLFLPCIGYAQVYCTDQTTMMFGVMSAYRASANEVISFTSIEILGNWRYAWILSLSHAFYKDSVILAQVVNKKAPVVPPYYGYGQMVDQTYTATLSTYGPGSYLTAIGLAAYSPYCDESLPPFNGMAPPGYTPIPTNGQASTLPVLVERPIITRSDPPPYYLGGSANSGTYSAQVTISSDPKWSDAGTPTYSFMYGSDKGTLSCTNCANPIYTATVPGAYCGDYAVRLKVSYGGFESDPLWIYNSVPDHVHHLATDQFPETWGWNTQKRLRVHDRCNSPMNYVPVNETFEQAQFDYPTTTAGWDLFNWAWGVWPTMTQYGEFTDFMFEAQASGKTPVPMTTGYNGYSEAPGATVMHALQKFFAASTTNGSGLQVQQNQQYHYLDHGAHK